MNDLKKNKKKTLSLEKKRMLRSVNTFKSSFYKKFGFEPVVVYEDLTDIKVKNIIRQSDYKITLELIEEACNEFLDRTQFPEGIRDRSRLQHLCMTRQLYMFFGYKFNFTISSIAKRIGFNHSMVVHAVKSINNVVDTNDKKYIKLYWQIKNKIYEKAGIKEDI